MSAGYESFTPRLGPLLPGFNAKEERGWQQDKHSTEICQVLHWGYIGGFIGVTLEYWKRKWKLLFRV